MKKRNLLIIPAVVAGVGLGAATAAGAWEQPKPKCPPKTTPTTYPTTPTTLPAPTTTTTTTTAPAEIIPVVPTTVPITSTPTTAPGNCASGGYAGCSGNGGTNIPVTPTPPAASQDTTNSPLPPVQVLGTAKTGESVTAGNG